ncbi:hypothetical protein PENSPDRAFT_646890 [Peniophora sp. CONT]|nr:hypothetical protein PENSPDRAFT_646890 [Peniophora sp. CONT]
MYLSLFAHPLLLPSRSSLILRPEPNPYCWIHEREYRGILLRIWRPRAGRHIQTDSSVNERRLPLTIMDTAIHLGRHRHAVTPCRNYLDLVSWF